MNSISRLVSSLPASNSTPAYRSSVFSRTMTRSTPSFTEEAAHTRIVLAGSHAGEQPEFLAQEHVDAAKAGPHRRRDRGLQRAAGTPDAREHRVGQRRAGLLHDIHTRLLDVPADVHSGRVDALSRRRRQLGTGPIPGDQRHFMSHVDSSDLLRASARRARTRHDLRQPLRWKPPPAKSPTSSPATPAGSAQRNTTPRVGQRTVGPVAANPHPVGCQEKRDLIPVRSRLYLVKSHAGYGYRTLIGRLEQFCRSLAGTFGSTQADSWRAEPRIHPAPWSWAPTTSMQHDQFIEQQLARTRRRVKWVDLGSLAMGLVGGIIAFLMIVVVFDHWVADLGRPGRLVALLVLLLGATYYVAAFLVPPFLRRINPGLRRAGDRTEQPVAQEQPDQLPDVPARCQRPRIGWSIRLCGNVPRWISAT